MAHPPRTTKVRRTTRTDRARATFLTALRETCNVAGAARTAGIGRSSAYEWRRDDPAFAAAWDEAEAEAIDNLEGVVYRRAMEGHSDRLAEILLKGHRPERYADRSKIEHGGTVAIERISREFVRPKAKSDG